MIGRLLMAAAVVALTVQRAAAQTGAQVGAQTGDLPKIPTVSLAIALRAIQKPVLQYALVFGADETHKGNAAVKYLEAAQDLPTMIGIGGGRRMTEQDYDAIDKLRTEPLADFDERKAQEYLPYYKDALDRAQEGSRLESYDAETDIREKGVLAMLPSLGKYREIANMLAVAIRLDIKHHRWAQARQKLATGYGMARHLAQGDTLISALVGAAIANVMTRCLDDWVQEGGPNLYWELVNLPHPLVNMRRGLSFERAEELFSFPEMKEMREGKYSADLWISLFNRFREAAGANGTAADVLGGPALSAEKQQSAGVIYGVLEYPDAKAFLEARGMAKDEVEKMPVAEVLGRYFLRSYDEEADDMFKAFGLPPAQAVVEAERAERAFARPGGDENPLARLLIPSLGKAVVLGARVDRSLDMLRIVEALRAYAADKGRFPEKLDDIGLPVPEDVITGKPFEYRRDGDTATLTSPAKNPHDGAVLVVRLKH